MLLLFNPQCRTGPPLRFVYQCSNAKVRISEHNTKQKSNFLLLLSNGSTFERELRDTKKWAQYQTKNEKSVENTALRRQKNAKGTFILGFGPLEGEKNHRFFCVCDYLLLSLQKINKLVYENGLS